MLQNSRVGKKAHSSHLQTSKQASYGVEQG